MGMVKPAWYGEYWKRSEFECGCGCGADEIHPSIVELADAVRRKIGVSLKCNSGVRCATHNKDVDGMPDSYHVPQGAMLWGYASDFSFFNHHYRTPLGILRLYTLFESYGRKHGNVGLGLYPWGVHVDVRGKLGKDAGRWESGFPWQSY